jgi:hypothetical protein
MAQSDKIPKKVGCQQTCEAENQLKPDHFSEGLVPYDLAHPNDPDQHSDPADKLAAQIELGEGSGHG